jgi:anti-sigma B factor antagonist
MLSSISLFESGDVPSRLCAMSSSMNDVEYVSSAALRAILNANDQLSEKGGSLTLRNVNKKIMEIFNITGFADYLNIV